MKVLPIGYIESWSGPLESIPKGWALCDGTNGTLDLRVKKYAGKSLNPEDIGGWAFHEDGTPALYPIQKVEEVEA